ncbi:MAG: DedA family protein [Sulfurovum sp.]|nr:DedA family protein [Sulfurovaceae bacterium]
MIHQIADMIVESIGSIGYIGIFFLMFLESSFFPFPSEIVMIPAGYLAFQGDMNIYFAILMGILGSLAGALFNYYLALHFGRSFLLKYGKYFFLKEKNLDDLETFFNKHGEVSIFNGRLIPGIRQYISLPAGLSKMNIYKFSFFTSLGAGIWVIVLTALGYFLGANQDMVKEYLHIATIISLISVGLITLFYIIRVKVRKSL